MKPLHLHYSDIIKIQYDLLTQLGIPCSQKMALLQLAHPPSFCFKILCDLYLFLRCRKALLKFQVPIYLCSCNSIHDIRLNEHRLPFPCISYAFLQIFHFISTNICTYKENSKIKALRKAFLLAMLLREPALENYLTEQTAGT